MFFISSQKLFLFSRCLSFYFDYLVLYQNGFIKKNSLISEFMTSQPGQQTIVIHILPNISRNKGNQTIKFGQLIECNMRNIFLEKLYAKCVGETSPRRFSENLKLSISLDQSSKVLYSFLLLYGKLKAIKTYQNQVVYQLLSPHIKLFQNIKRGLALVSLPYFRHNFSRKIFLLLYSINGQNFIVWLHLL